MADRSFFQFLNCHGHYCYYKVSKVVVTITVVIILLLLFAAIIIIIIVVVVIIIVLLLLLLFYVFVIISMVVWGGSKILARRMGSGSRSSHFQHTCYQFCQNLSRTICLLFKSTAFCMVKRSEFQETFTCNNF